MYDDDVMDCAREWVGEHYPDAEGAEYEAHLRDAARDIAAIWTQADRDEERMGVRS